MPTKTFSSRAEEQSIALADSLAQREFGMSFAKYCGSILLKSVCETKRFPKLENDDAKESKIEALEALKSFGTSAHNSEIAAMSDTEIKQMIGERYA